MGKNNITRFNFHTDGRLFYAAAVKRTQEQECVKSANCHFCPDEKEFQHINCLGSRVPIVEVVEREISRIESKRGILPVCVLPVVIC